MKINVRNISFRYTDKPIFANLSIELEGGDRPLVILGPSGSGKTTLLKLLGGLLNPDDGEIFYSDTGMAKAPETAFMFQESRLLPWLTVLENISLPLTKIFGREEGRVRARQFLSLVSLADREETYPGQLSGGQAQRVSMARAFAWPAPALFMDEPFQSLDVPLRISLMENCLSLLEKENFIEKEKFFKKENFLEKKRLVIAVSHDPREAIFLGARVVILGQAGEGVVYDRNLQLSAEDRAYGSSAARELEREMVEVLRGSLC